MSAFGIFNKLALSGSYLFSEIKKFPDNKTIKNRAVGLSILMAGHAGYFLFSKKTDDIKVIKKYKIVRGGFTQFMIIDDKDNHYNVNNSLWQWKWDSIEDYHNKIEENKSIKITYYGYRIPILGLFPNIVKSEIIGN
jgi:hypothetical protein